MKYYKEIRFRLTSEEKAALVALAKRAGLSQSAYVRRLIQRKAAIVNGPPAKEANHA